MATCAALPDYCGFLALPTELRCHIYEYLLADSQSITVSAGHVTAFGNRIEDRTRQADDIPGLPLDLTPLARLHYDASILLASEPPEIAIDNGWPSGTGTNAQIPMPATMALLLTCHQINDELTDYERGRKQIKAAQASLPTLSQPKPQQTGDASTPTPVEVEGLSLYVSYPYGVLVLKSLYPYLLKQASRIQITGYHKTHQAGELPSSPTTSEEGSDGEQLTPSGSFEVTRSFGTTRSGRSFRKCQSPTNTSASITRPRQGASNGNTVRPRLRLDSVTSQQSQQARTFDTVFPAFPTDTGSLAPDVLSQLIRTVLPDHITQLTQFSIRIIYPGPNASGEVWSHEDSPVSRVLQNMCGGKIHLRVKRGCIGTGLAMNAWPKPQVRIVSTGWENWRGYPGRRYEERYKELDKFLLEA